MKKNIVTVSVILIIALLVSITAYAMFYKKIGSQNSIKSGSEKLSQGVKYSFAIQADSHLDEKTDINLYKRTLLNIVDEKPEFLMDLGDTFMAEKYAKSKEEVNQRYKDAKELFSIINPIPVYLVNGNHDGEVGWGSGKGQKDMISWSQDARHIYFPEKIIQENYTGNQSTANYFSFQKGDTHFIVLDPFTFSTKKASNNKDGWNYTLGKVQYDWLNETLSKSKSKYKLVFIHNLVGGYGKDARGGAEAAKYFEWGGNSIDGSYQFDKMRSGWGKPIHQVLLEYGVTAVFHGHDHFYAYQEFDGIVYQLVPQPGTPGNSVNDAEKYSYQKGKFLPSAGFLKVVENNEGLLVNYLKTSLKSSENKTNSNSYILKGK